MGLDRSAYLRESHGATVTWLPFHLHPEIPEGGISADRAYARMGGATAYLAHLSELASDAGLPFDPPAHVPNTRLTLEASEWVRQRATASFDRFHHGVFHAYWADGWDIEDLDVLTDLAATAGVGDVTSLRRALDDRSMGSAVDAGKRAAFDAGASGTPAFLIDRRILVPGAQPREVFDRIIGRMRSVDDASG